MILNVEQWSVFLGMRALANGEYCNSVHIHAKTMLLKCIFTYRVDPGIAHCQWSRQGSVILYWPMGATAQCRPIPCYVISAPKTNSYWYRIETQFSSSPTPVVPATFGCRSCGRLKAMLELGRIFGLLLHYCCAFDINISAIEVQVTYMALTRSSRQSIAAQQLQLHCGFLIDAPIHSIHSLSMWISRCLKIGVMRANMCLWFKSKPRPGWLRRCWPKIKSVTTK